MDLSVLRELFRNYHQWWAVYELTGNDTIVGPDGQDYCIWDLQYLYEHALPLLAPRQKEAILIYLVENKREVDAATVMGLSPASPVGIYATTGLENIIGMIDRGELSKYRGDR